MAMKEYWHTQWRPNHFNPNKAVPEKKPIHAQNQEEAIKLVSEMPPDRIGGKEYKREFIKPYFDY
jgi:hypothetical protein